MSRVAAGKDELQAQIDKDPPDIEKLTEAITEAREALKEAQDGRKGKPSKDEAALEEVLNATLEKADALLSTASEAAKKAKEQARKRLMQAGMKAAPFTGDRAELEAAVVEAQDVNVPEKEVADAQGKLQAMISFHFMLESAAKELKEATLGGGIEQVDALDLDTTNLERVIGEVSEGAMKTLQKTVVELYLGLLTKPAPTAVATEVLDAKIAEAVEFELDENIIKSMKKKSEEAKKAQNAKKIADRKAKKPPTDPPKPPAEPEASPKVEELKAGLEGAMETAKAKLFESKSAHALVEAAFEDLLTSEALLDLAERPRAEAHPNIAALEAALATAKEAKCVEGLLGAGQQSLDEARKKRDAARTLLARTQLLAAKDFSHSKTNVDDLGKAIAAAEAEVVDEESLEEAKKHLYLSYKTQSEEVLQPLAEPEPISHEGFMVIDPLTKALEEARKRGAVEDLIIKGQAKLDMWLKARERRDNAKKELDKSLSPPPCTVDQPHVVSCLREADDSRLDPELLKAAQEKLKVAELAQRVYAKAKAPPGKLAIDVLDDELEVIGGGALALEQQRQKQCEQRVEIVTANIEAIKETMQNQKQRDAALAKQVKKGKKKEKPGLAEEEDLLPAWVIKTADEEDAGEGRRGSILTVAERQKEELAVLEEDLKAAKEALAEQTKAVESFSTTVVVPPDVVTYAQLKLKAAKACDEMIVCQKPELLVLDTSKLHLSIKQCEVKFGELPIAGLDDLDCNVPPEEIKAAKERLREAQRAQARQTKARSQLAVRVTAPTGTSTFGTLVKLVAEAKAAGVESDLIKRGELKLKKMEELAASSLRAGPLAFVSFHLPCLRQCVAAYATSLVEQAELKRQAEEELQHIASEALIKEIGSWQKGNTRDHSLWTADVDALKGAVMGAAKAGLPQEMIEMGRMKLVAIDKYRADRAAGKIKDAAEEKAKEEAERASTGGKAKKKFKNYGYVKKVEEDAQE